MDSSWKKLGPNGEINKELQSHKEDIKSLKSRLDSIEVGMNKQHAKLKENAVQARNIT
jgi:flagellar capping protein FliD